MSQRTQPVTDTDAFLLGHAESPDWEKAAEQCLQQIGYIPPKANLGFLYVTDAYARTLGAILEHLRDETGIQQWVGTVGMAICASGKEYHDTAAMAALVTTVPRESFRILPSLERLPEIDLVGLESWLQQSPSHLAVIHGDPRNPEIPELIERLAERLPGGYLVGGLSSSRSTYPQIAENLTGGGISGVVFNTEAPVVTALSQGCVPIAGQHVITACDRNVLIGIDDRPALDVFYEDIGEILARDPNRVAGYIFAGLPIPGSDTGDYLVRNLVGIDPDQKLLAIGDLVEKGQTIQFCRRDGRAAWDDLRRMLQQLKQRLRGRTPKGGVYYSCLGRGRELFGDDSEELRTIRQELGDIPLVGFFANGEVSCNRLYGYTGVLTVFV
jgi:small ligand-binding sensory domain FIST